MSWLSLIFPLCGILVLRDAADVALWIGSAAVGLAMSWVLAVLTGSAGPGVVIMLAQMALCAAIFTRQILAEAGR